MEWIWQVGNVTFQVTWTLDLVNQQCELEDVVTWQTGKIDVDLVTWQIEVDEHVNINLAN
jgi:hypothetical protein